MDDQEFTLYPDDYRTLAVEYAKQAMLEYISEHGKENVKEIAKVCFDAFEKIYAEFESLSIERGDGPASSADIS